ncbi:hypothetical protein N7495_005510 [Penicillium taxi]|uniref:uncharacterized protein n=1 Tax=Penicillium taxi TaxID=168475 RepID=UPI00254525E9|nr:uncharacterized protein N7495_005510 [Penicillium taxi]KAJ5893819.1 hypothetical protein N7495_005510 [Penicillium taxi]
MFVDNSKTLDDLSNVLACSRHLKKAPQAKTQWYAELKENEVERQISSKLDKFKHLNKPDAPSNISGDSVSSTQVPILEFVHFTPSVADVITDLLCKKLERKDMAQGWIYVFSSTITPSGMLKIGFSGRDPTTSRFRAHKSCYHDVHMVEIQSDVPHAYRVEQLVLKELSPYRRRMREPCLHCTFYHGEWLQIEQQKLLKTLNKWIKFVKSEPYDSDGNLIADTKLPPPALKQYQRHTPRKSRKSQVSPELDVEQLTASVSQMKIGDDQDGSMGNCSIQ